MTNAADKAIEEIREVRRHISAGFGHDIAKHIARLQEDQKQHPEQVRRGQELLARRNAKKEPCPQHIDATRALRDEPKD